MTAATAPTPEVIAHQLWQERRKFRALHATDFATEMTILSAVRNDLRGKFYHDHTTAVSFYRDLNTATLQEQHA